MGLNWLFFLCRVLKKNNRRVSLGRIPTFQKNKKRRNRRLIKTWVEIYVVSNPVSIIKTILTMGKLLKKTTFTWEPEGARRLIVTALLKGYLLLAVIHLTLFPARVQMGLFPFLTQGINWNCVEDLCFLIYLEPRYLMFSGEKRKDQWANETASRTCSRMQ